VTITPFIVGIGGTTRPDSSSELLVKQVLFHLEKQGAQTQMFGGAKLAGLPHYAPENDQRSDDQKYFIEAVRNANAFVIGSPAYHGGVSGLVKNALDLLEDLREDPVPYCAGRPVGTVVTAAGWQGCGVTLQSLRGIIHALRGWPTPLGIAVNSVKVRLFNHDGDLIDTDTSNACKIQAEQIINFLRTESKPNAND
jgi:FMN reductase